MNTQNYDAIIIGSGLGGLTCGAMLAKSGKKVLVLEQHDLIGGCATCFKRKGMLVDAGLHEMDLGTKKTDMKHIIFKKLGLLDKITIVPLPSAWTIRVLDSKASHTSQNMQDFFIPHKTTKEALIAYFPHEKKGITQYFKKIYFQAKLNYKFPFDMNFWEFFFAPFHTLSFFAISAFRQRKVGNMLDSMIQDSQLKRILNINMVYYHYNAWKFNWNYHAIAQTNYYNQGIYIKGGSQALSDALAEIIRENGGEVHTRCDVTKILLDEDKAIGVAYVDTKAKQTKEVFGKNIVANCDPRNVYETLLDLNHSSTQSPTTPQKHINITKDLNLTKNLTTKTSLVSVYMVFDTNLSEKFPDMDYSTFCVDKEYFDLPFDKAHEDLLKIAPEDRSFVFVNYSKIDSGLSDRQDRYLGVITTLGTYDEWEGLDKEEYKAKKQRIQQSYEAKLEKFFPGIMSFCVHSEFATPKTIERYIRTQKGTPYGWDQDLEGFWGRGRFKSKSIKNLYFASVFGFPGAGFTGGLLAGYRTARKMLDPYFYPRRLSLCVIVGVAISLGVIKCLEYFS